MKPHLELSEISEELKIDLDRQAIRQKPRINFGFQKVDDDDIFDDTYTDSLIHSDIYKLDIEPKRVKSSNIENFEEQPLQKDTSKESQEFTHWIDMQISHIKVGDSDLNEIIEKKKIDSSKIVIDENNEKRLVEKSKFNNLDENHITKDKDNFFATMEESCCINNDIESIGLAEQDFYLKNSKEQIPENRSNDVETQIMGTIRQSLENYQDSDVKIDLNAMLSGEKKKIQKCAEDDDNLDKDSSKNELPIFNAKDKTLSPINNQSIIDIKEEKPKKLTITAPVVSKPELIPKSVKNIKRNSNKCSLENSENQAKNQFTKLIDRNFTLSEFNETIIKVQNNSVSSITEYESKNINESMQNNKQAKTSFMDLHKDNNLKSNENYVKKIPSVVKGLKALTPVSNKGKPLFPTPIAKNLDIIEKPLNGLSAVKHDIATPKSYVYKENFEHSLYKENATKNMNENKKTWRNAQELSSCSFKATPKSNKNTNKRLKNNTSMKLDRSMNNSTCIEKTKKTTKKDMDKEQYNNNNPNLQIKLNNKTKIDSKNNKGKKIINNKTPIKGPISSNLKPKMKDNISRTNPKTLEYCKVTNNKQNKNRENSSFIAQNTKSAIKNNISYMSRETESQIREKLLEEIYHALERTSCLGYGEELCDLKLSFNEIVQILQELNFLPSIESEFTDDTEKLLHVMWMIMSVEETKAVTVKELTIFIMAIYGLSIVDLLDEEDTFLAQSDVKEIKLTYRQLKVYKEKRDKAMISKRENNKAKSKDIEAFNRKQNHDSRMANNRKQKIIEKALRYSKLDLLPKFDINALTHVDIMTLEAKIKSIEADIRRQEKENEQLAKCTFKPKIRCSNVSSRLDTSSINMNQEQSRSLTNSELNASMAAIKLDIRISDNVKERIYVYPDTDIDEQVDNIASKLQLDYERTEKLRIVLWNQINCP